MSQNTDTSETSTETQEELQKVADMASQMGHAVDKNDGLEVRVSMLNGEQLVFKNLKVIDVSNPAWRVDVEGEYRGEFDEYDTAVSAAVDQLLI